MAQRDDFGGFFAAMMAAIRAMPSTSPFFAEPDSTSASVCADRAIVAVAVAVRAVVGLADTSTMCAAPCASKWVRGDFFIVVHSHPPLFASVLLHSFEFYLF